MKTDITSDDVMNVNSYEPADYASIDFSDPKYIGKHLQQFLEDGDISADDVNVMCVTAKIPNYLTDEIYEAALKGEFKRVGKKVAWCMDNLDDIHVQSIVYFVGNVNAILDS